MPFDYDDASADSPPGSGDRAAISGSHNQGSAAPGPPRRRGILSRRNAIISGIVIGVGAVVLVFLGLLAYRLGFVDRYVAGQIKDTLSNYGVRAEIREFHTSFSPQTVEMLGVELF